MKIKNEKDIELLDQRIQNLYGIELKKYRNEEVVENLVSIIVFPQYVLNWIIRPVLLAIILFVVGFFVLQLVHIEYVIYGIFGLVLFLFTGLLLGLMLFLWRLKNDIGGIIDYALDILKSTVLDTKRIDNSLGSYEKKKVLDDLFKGVTHIIIMPSLLNIISDKIPILSVLVNGIVKNVITQIVNTINFNESSPNEVESDGSKLSDGLENYTNSIVNVSNGFERIMNTTLKVINFPLIVLFIGSVIVLLLFLYFIN